MNRLINVFLGFVIIGLIIVFINQTHPELDLAQPATPVERSRISVNQPERPVRPLDTYAELSSRNLFHPDRHDPGRGEEEAFEEEAPPSLIDPEELVLHGVVLSEPDRFAWISGPEDVKPKRYSPGDEINQYIIEKVLTDRVFLRTGEQIAQLTLKSKRRDDPRRRLGAPGGLAGRFQDRKAGAAQPGGAKGAPTLGTASRAAGGSPSFRPPKQPSTGRQALDDRLARRAEIARSSWQRNQQRQPGANKAGASRSAPNYARQGGAMDDDGQDYDEDDYGDEGEEDYPEDEPERAPGHQLNLSGARQPPNRDFDFPVPPSRGISGS